MTALRQKLDKLFLHSEDADGEQSLIDSSFCTNNVLVHVANCVVMTSKSSESDEEDGKINSFRF